MAKENKENIALVMVKVENGWYGTIKRGANALSKRVFIKFPEKEDIEKWLKQV